MGPVNDKVNRLFDQPRFWKFLSIVSICLSSLTFFLAAYGYTRLHDLSIQGCSRQNELRVELNRVLTHFRQKPAFRLTDCDQAWRLYGPAPPPQPYVPPTK